jgi:hypothetical protein
LWGLPFTVRTDHYSLKFILDQRLPTIPQHTWVSKLFGYDLEVEYRARKFNGAADASSRREDTQHCLHAISAPTFEFFDVLREECSADPQVVAIRASIQAVTAKAGWTESFNLLLFNSKVFVPDSSSVWTSVLADTHEAGHERVEKTAHRLRASFYNPHILKRVREYVRGCAVCQRNKSEHLHPAGLLQPLTVPSEVWSDIAMDFIEGFPKVGGKLVILTVVVRFSKFAHFIQLSHPYSASSVARAFFDHIIRLHRFPCSIVSGRDTVFTSVFWKELFKLAGVQLCMSSAFHP